MSRLLDPTVCPDCRAPLTPDARCTGCGLALTGPRAVELRRTMELADSLVEELRRLSTVTAPVAAGAEPVPAAAAVPPTAPADAARRSLPGRSVPTILLGLGALCLLVAGIVFVAVTWSVLGLTGRTLVLLAVTSLLLGGAAAVSRRGLRAGAETLWVLGIAMLVVDLLAANATGLPLVSGLGWRGLAALVGGTAFTVGAGAAVWARSQPLGRLYGGQVAAGLGLLLVTTTDGWGAARPAVGALAAVVLLGAVAWVLRRLLEPLAWWAGALAVGSWLALLADGFDRIEVPATEWYLHLAGWPLVAASAVAPALALAPTRLSRMARVPEVRSLAAAGSLLPLAGFAMGPGSGLVGDLLQLCAVVGVLAVVSALGPLAWARAAAVWGGLALAGLAVLLAGQPAALLAPVVEGPGAALRVLEPPPDSPAPWVWTVVAVTIAGTAAGLLRHLPSAERGRARVTLATVAPVVLLLGAATTVTGSPVPLWVAAVAHLVVLGSATAGVLVLRDESAGAAVATALVVLAGVDTLLASVADPLLLAATTTTGALFLALPALALRRTSLWSVGAPGFAAASTLVGGLAVVAWSDDAGTTDEWRSWALAGYVALVLLGSVAVPARSLRRVAVEAALLPVALACLPMTDSLAATAISLTVLGSALALVGLVEEEREAFRWAASVVLFVAALLRFSVGTSAPELVTLPAAAVLVGVGVHRLLRRPGAGSYRMLTPGVVLGLGPSLLIALTDPVSLRGALVAGAALVLLAVGLERRWGLPVVAGACAGALLALRHLAPLTDAVPRWATLAAVGLGLLLVGVSWEDRMRDLRTAGRYLRALR